MNGGEAMENWIEKPDLPDAVRLETGDYAEVEQRKLSAMGFRLLQKMVWGQCESIYRSSRDSIG